MKNYKADLDFYKSAFKYQSAILNKLKKENKELKLKLEKMQDKKAL